MTTAGIVVLLSCAIRAALAADPTPLQELDRGEARTYSMAFSPDGKLLAAAQPPAIRIWNVESWKVSKQLEPETTTVLSLAYSPDGKRLAFGGNKFAATVWNLAENRAEHYLQGLGDDVLSVAFSPDGNLVAFANQEVVRLYDLRPEKPVLRRGSRALGRVFSVAFSPDGKKLAAAAFNEETQFCLWDFDEEGVLFDSRRVLHKPKLITGGRLQLRTIAFVGDGDVLIGSTGPDVFLMQPGADDTKITRVGSHQAIKRSTPFVRNIAVSPDGTWAATACEADGVRLWDLKAHRLIAYLPEFGAWSVAISPDGKLLVTAGIDLAPTVRASTKVWDVSKIVSPAKGSNGEK